MKATDKIRSSWQAEVQQERRPGWTKHLGHVFFALAITSLPTCLKQAFAQKHTYLPPSSPKVILVCCWHVLYSSVWMWENSKSEIVQSNCALHTHNTHLSFGVDKVGKGTTTGNLSKTLTSNLSHSFLSLSFSPLPSTYPYPPLALAQRHALIPQSDLSVLFWGPDLAAFGNANFSCLLVAIRPRLAKNSCVYTCARECMSKMPPFGWMWIAPVEKQKHKALAISQTGRETHPNFHTLPSTPHTRLWAVNPSILFRLAGKTKTQRGVRNIIWTSRKKLKWEKGWNKGGHARLLHLFHGLPSYLFAARPGRRLGGAVFYRSWGGAPSAVAGLDLWRILLLWRPALFA